MPLPAGVKIDGVDTTVALTTVTKPAVGDMLEHGNRGINAYRSGETKSRASRIGGSEREAWGDSTPPRHMI